MNMGMEIEPAPPTITKPDFRSAKNLVELIGMLEQSVKGRSQSKSSVPKVGASTVVETARGMEAKVRYVLIEMGDLVASHDLLGKQNPEFPANYQDSTRSRIKARLQNRDRSSKSSQAQIHKIAGALRPRLLGANPLASDGAPITSSKLKPGKFVVVSGNGRTLALLSAAAHNPNSYQDYRDWLTQEAQSFGFTPQEVEVFKAPALVRDLQVDLTAEELTRFVKEANKPSILAPSAEEVAVEDASELTGEMLQKAQVGPDGRINGSKNSEFIRLFIDKVLGGDPAETGRLFNDKGLTDEGADRITRAVFMRAFGDSRLLDKLVSRGDDQSKKLTRGLMLAAPELARLGDRIAANGRYDLDIASDLVAAVQKLEEIRATYKGEDPVGEYFRQTTFDEMGIPESDQVIVPEQVKKIIQTLYQAGIGRRGSADKVRDFLLRYAKLANDELAMEEQAEDDSLVSFSAFGVAEKRDKDALIEDSRVVVFAESAWDESYRPEFYLVPFLESPAAARIVLGLVEGEARFYESANKPDFSGAKTLEELIQMLRKFVTADPHQQFRLDPVPLPETFLALVGLTGKTVYTDLGELLRKRLRKNDNSFASEQEVLDHILAVAANPKQMLKGAQENRLLVIGEPHLNQRGKERYRNFVMEIDTQKGVIISAHILKPNDLRRKLEGSKQEGGRLYHPGPDPHSEELIRGALIQPYGQDSPASFGILSDSDQGVKTPHHGGEQPRKSELSGHHSRSPFTFGEVIRGAVRPLDRHQTRTPKDGDGTSSSAPIVGEPSKEVKALYRAENKEDGVYAVVTLGAKGYHATLFDSDEEKPIGTTAYSIEKLGEKAALAKAKDRADEMVGGRKTRFR